MTENTNTNTINLEELIDQLPGNFPAAAEAIKYEIAPLINDCNSGLRLHYIELIKKKTKAASRKSVSLLIEETTKELDASKSQNTADHDKAPAPDDEETKELANQIALDPFLFRKKIDIVTGMGVIGERRNIGIYFLVIDSRSLPMAGKNSEALAMKNSGHQGAGKSYPLFTTLRIYSKNAYHLISSGSEKSMLFIEGGLKFKALILAEALQLESHGNKDSELAYAIRTLISEGHMTYQYMGYVEKKRTTIVKSIKGPTSLVTTTIADKLEKQLDDRMITVHPNTSADQTRYIIRQTAQNASGNNTCFDDKLIRAFQVFHDSLLSIEVIIPFALDIADYVDQQGSLPMSARRSFKRVLSAIKTMTLIHQKQRRKDAQGRLIAEYSDYHLVYQLLEKTFAESLGKIERHTDARTMLIEKYKLMTPKALSEKTGVSVAAISQWIKPLIEKGVLDWCDEYGQEFVDTDALEKAKRSGKAFIYVTGGKCLPSTFQLTGDPRWDKGGELYEMYDLKLDYEDGDQEMFSVAEVTASEPESLPIENERAKDREGVKVLSGKTQDDIKKMVADCKKNQPEFDPDAPEVIELENEFEQIVLPNNYSRSNAAGLLIL